MTSQGFEMEPGRGFGWGFKAAVGDQIGLNGHDTSVKPAAESRSNLPAGKSARRNER
jgi:hypothetical protein